VEYINICSSMNAYASNTLKSNHNLCWINSICSVFHLSQSE
jgi:hypothetical protein